MSITVPPPASSNGHERRQNGVRTYRGRTLAELIPQIREELGPEAIILREREGLIGGVNGFFAKRCVEVDARRAMPLIDVYDDDDEEASDMAAAPVVDPDSHTEQEDERMAQATRDARAEAARKAAAARERRAAAARQRRAAAAAAAAEEPRVNGADEGTDVTAEQNGAGAEALGPESFAEHLVAAQVDPAAHETQIETAEAAPATAAQPIEEREPEPENAPEPVTDSAPTIEAAVAEPAPEPIAAPAPPARKRGLTTRRSARKLTMPGQVARRPEPFDLSGATAIAQELVVQGVSQAEAQRLVGQAAAHCSPFAGPGGLREAVRRALASGMPRLTTPPAAGRAVAFVGAGGGGKTRCTAALATAYGRASTLSVTVVSLGAVDRGRALKELLKPERIDVKSAANANKGAIQATSDRGGAIVVIDTLAAAPGNQAAVRELAAELESLALDAIYVTVPATLGAQAARQLLQGLKPLGLSGIVITHADETDQLGVAVELAWTSGVPVAYVHEGLELTTALSAPDPVDLARRLLP